jgi:hypothetical protein
MTRRPRTARAPVSLDVVALVVALVARRRKARGGQ